MIDFRRENLHEKDQRKFNKFKKYKLVLGHEVEEEDNLEEEDDDGLTSGGFLDGDGIDLGTTEEGMEDEGFGSFGDAGDRSGVKDDMGWKKDNSFLTFILAPFYLIKYVFQDMINDFPNKIEWKGIIKVLNTINIICFVTAILAVLIGLKTIFTPSFQIILGVSLYIITTLILVLGYKEDTILTAFFKRIFGKEVSESDESGIDFGDGEFGSENAQDIVMDDFEIGEGFEEGTADEDEEIEREDDEDLEDNKYKMKNSPIEIESLEEFDHTLLSVYKENSKNTGRVINDRLKLVKSFGDYLIQNSNSFGKWKRPKERGTEFNNISYALYKGICKIDSAFGSYTPRNEDEQIERMVVHDIRKSPLLYRVEIELPDRIREKKLQANIEELEDMVRESEDDLEVSILISTFRGNIIIKLMRFDSKELVSLGDILRFYDEDKGNVGLQAFDNNKMGLPLLFGLQNNEYPHVVDMEGNTSGTIVGGSGSGKSWATFEMMLNFVVSNDYNNVNFIVLDLKNAPFWRNFARFPHVLGYHSNIDDYINILREVDEERLKRQELLVDLGEEDIKGYREHLREEGEFDKLKEFPLLFVIIDEITATMQKFKEEDEELFKTVKSLMTQIASQGRSAGVRILSIGQRSVDESIPKGLMANSSFKFGMKMEVDADFEKMFGDDIKKYKKPNTKGMGLSKEEGVTTLQNIKTLTIGGKNNKQMMRIIRVLAFEWIRRSHGVDDLEKMPDGMNLKESYTRNMYLHQSKKEMEEGKILTPTKVDKGTEFDFESGLIGQNINEETIESGNEDIDFEEKEDKNMMENTEEDTEIEEDFGEEDVEEEVEEEAEEEIDYGKNENEEKEIENEKNDENKDEDIFSWEDLQKQLFENDDGTEIEESKEYEEVEEIEDGYGNNSENKEIKKEEESESNDDITLEELIDVEDNGNNESEQDKKKEEIEGEQYRETEGNLSEEEENKSENGSEVNEKSMKNSENRVENMEKEEKEGGGKKEEDLKEIDDIERDYYRENNESKESGEIEIEFDAPNSAVNAMKEPSMSIKSYVMENGFAKGLNFYIRKDDLHRVYTNQKIEDSLNRMLIIENGSYYIAKM